MELPRENLLREFFIGLIVTVHGQGLAHFSRDQSPVLNARTHFERRFFEKNVPVPLHWPLNGYGLINSGCRDHREFALEVRPASL